MVAVKNTNSSLNSELHPRRPTEIKQSSVWFMPYLSPELRANFTRKLGWI